VDKPFGPVTLNRYSAVTADGFHVDILTLQPKDKIKAPRLKIATIPTTCMRPRSRGYPDWRTLGRSRR
jgi:hypothetical protein